MAIKDTTKKQKKMSRAIISTMLLCLIVSAVIAAFAISYFTLELVLDATGESRVDVLQQVSDSNSVTRTNMTNVMDVVYEDFYQLLAASTSDQTDVHIEQELNDLGEYLERIGLNFTIDIVMNDGRIFTTDSDQGNIENLMSSYWYIRHYSGMTDTSWNLRSRNIDNVLVYGLSYGKTIWGQEGNSIGILVITSSQEVLFRALMELIEGESQVYIIDQNGIIIYHTNEQRIGNWMTSIDIFEEAYGFNTYSVIQRYGKEVMLSNYFDPDSGWVFVEEQSMDTLLENGLIAAGNCLIVILIGCVIAGLLANLRIKHITGDLIELTKKLKKIPVDGFSELTVNDKYEEINILETAFNEMIVRIQTLVDDVFRREREKQKTEYDFLQAQINPHFLNNTFLAAKSLLAMGDIDGVKRMLDQLIQFLHIPMSPEIQFIPLKEEAQLIEGFISIMNCRTEKGVEFFNEIPDEMLLIPIPRMILQPIVDNSFFHGFAERNKNCCIWLKGKLQGNRAYIEIKDNGEGISAKRVEEVLSGNYKSNHMNHGIGLKNIEKRLKIIYGDNSRLEIKSKFNEYTSVTLVIDDYRRIEKAETIQSLVNEGARDENNGR